ncbi:acyl-CoA dehydrogenase [Sphingobium sp. SCG-1]|uniref:acyl-CoA dehydrogenase n=1 Tax=Sphingobium sp. SCG-1 TaxID=2072936 RepID=UPI000CD682A4|nr:acyl-CoA dehydrogenase [Sphingobium sp. SCG-1]AUW58175.1 acyl-CoA dehydrogenase [Sphingobium sp. SCG-1]
MPDTNFPDWKPELAEVTDFLTAAPLRRLAAVLDADHLPSPSDELPPLAHWLFFLPEDKQSTLSRDGHPERGGFLPPVPALRRMWAGGSLEFLRPVPLEVRAVKRSVVEAVETKQGTAGPLTFVTLLHSLLVDGEEYVRERQNLVYLNDAPARREAKASMRVSERTRPVSLDITALFRFSALTFNAHRIHYDESYARQIEGYTGLLVHGPFQAMLLMDHLLRSFPGARVQSFSFRAVRPLVVSGPFELRLSQGNGQVEIWTVDDQGAECMAAKATLA